MSPSALVMFFATGAASLIYQTVWMRMLVRAFGVTVWATTTVVAVFMAGLAIGALYAARTADRTPSLARWGRVELGVAASAVAATLLIDAMPLVWPMVPADAANVLTAVRVILLALCLLVPTTLMGMTLPLLVAVWKSERAVSVLYAVNTLGAVVGALGVGFVLLAGLGERGSVGVAVFLNVAAGLFALVLGRRHAQTAPPADATADHAPVARPAGLWVAAAIGFAMLGFEIAWTRLLVFLVGSSTYAFSSMLAMYLAGVAAGGFVAARRPSASPRMLGVTILVLSTFALLSTTAFAWLGGARLGPEYTYSPLQTAADLGGFLITSALVVMPTTFLSGMLFPWLVTFVLGSTGRGAGSVYAWNTIGAVAGATVSGFLLIPALGAVGAVFALATFTAVVGVVLLFSTNTVRSLAVALGLAGVVAAMAVVPTHDVTAEIVGARFAAVGYRLQRHVETIDTSVSIVVPLPGAPVTPSLVLNSIVTSSMGAASELMAHVPLLMQEAPGSALVVCFGVGGTFAAAAQHVDEVHTVELVAQVIESYPLFGGDPALLSARQNRAFVDDGRNFLLRSKRRYDAIVVDAAPPIYGAGAVNLYSREMMELVAAHLSDDGVFLLWLPTMTWRSDIWSVIRGVTDTFKHTGILASTGSGILVLAGHKPLDLSPEHMLERARSRPRLSPAAISMIEGLRPQTPDLMSWQDAQVRTMASRYPPLTDDQPVTEFPLMHLLRHEPVITRGIDFLLD